MTNKLLKPVNRLVFVVLMLSFSAIAFAQNVGIGTNTPAVRLDVAGTGAFNLATTEGDFRMGDATNRLKMGVGNSGSNSGQAYIAASRRLFLGTSNSLARTQSLVVDSTGYVGMGVLFPAAPLDIVSAKSSGSVVLVRTAYNGNQNISAIRSTALVSEGYGVGIESIGGMAGGYFTSNGGSSPNESYGVYGKATGLGGLRAGVYGEATDGPLNWGGYFPTKTYVNDLRVGGFSGAPEAAATVTGKLVADDIGIVKDLTVNGTITGESSVTLAKNSGSVNIGNGSAGGVKLNVISDKTITALFYNQKFYALMAEGNVQLTRYPDNTGGNIGIGTGFTPNTKLIVTSNQTNTAIIENTDPVSTALSVKGKMISDGFVRLANSFDNSLGNVGIGNEPFLDTKLFVKSNQAYAAWVENINPANLALFVNGKMKLNGTTGTALNIVKGGDIRMEDDLGTSSVLMYTDITLAPGEQQGVLTVLSDGKLFAFKGTGGSVSSDARLKQDITPIDNSLEKLMQLNGYSYRFKTKSNDPQKELGVLAQEVKAVLPEAVYTDSKGMYSVSYNSLVPLLINAVKEQQQTLNKQQQEIADLKTMLINQQEITKRIAILEAAAGK